MEVIYNKMDVIEDRKGDWYLCQGCPKPKPIFIPDTDYMNDDEYLSLIKYCPNCGNEISEFVNR